MCWLNGALPTSPVASGSLGHTSNHHYHTVGYFLSFMWFEKWNYVLSSLPTFLISRVTWRNPGVGCHGWIHNWRSAYSSGHARSAACVFPAPEAEKRFWTTDECELQPQKVHGRGLVPSLCSLLILVGSDLDCLIEILAESLSHAPLAANYIVLIQVFLLSSEL